MVGDDNIQLDKNRGILKPSWAFVKTNNENNNAHLKFSPRGCPKAMKLCA